MYKIEDIDDFYVYPLHPLDLIYFLYSTIILHCRMNIFHQINFSIIEQCNLPQLYFNIFPDRFFCIIKFNKVIEDSCLPYHKLQLPFSKVVMIIFTIII